MGIGDFLTLGSLEKTLSSLSLGNLQIPLHIIIIINNIVYIHISEKNQYILYISYSKMATQLQRKVKIYKEVLAPPDGWDDEKAQLYQAELRKLRSNKQGLRTIVYPDSFPFIQFSRDEDDEDDEDDDENEIVKKGDKIVNIMGDDNPFTSEKWKDLIKPPEPPKAVLEQKQEVITPAFVNYPVNNPAIDIRTTVAAFTESYVFDEVEETYEYDIKKLIVLIGSPVISDDHKSILAGIYAAGKRVLNEISIKDGEKKLHVHQDIQAGVKYYLNTGLPSKYVNEYTFRRALADNPNLAEGQLTKYKIFHPDVYLPTGYKTWRKWATQMRTKYLNWLKNQVAISTVGSPVSVDEINTITVKQVKVPPLVGATSIGGQVKLKHVINDMKAVGAGSEVKINLCIDCDLVIHGAGEGSPYADNKDYRDLIAAMEAVPDKEVDQLDPLRVLNEGAGFRYTDNKGVIIIPDKNGLDVYYKNENDITDKKILTQKLISSTDLKHWIGTQHYNYKPGTELYGTGKNTDFTVGPQNKKMLQDMVDDVKKALQQINKLGFLHRDIKGDNIVVDGNNDLFLFDYDQARRFFSTEVMQTQYNGDYARLDYPVDVDMSEPDYSSLQVARDINPLLQERGLSLDGNKAAKVQRLQEDDAVIVEGISNRRRRQLQKADFDFVVLESVGLDYFQMGVILLNLGGKFDIADDFKIQPAQSITFGQYTLPVVGFFNTPIEKDLTGWNDIPNGKMNNAIMTAFVEALRNPTDDLANQFNLPKEILQRIGNEFFKTPEEMLARAQAMRPAAVPEPVRTTFLDYDSMSDAELEDLSNEMEFTDDELDRMLEEINVGQAKDDYDSMSDSAPTSIGQHSYDSSSDATELSYNSSSDITEESYNSSSDMSEAYDSISELSASYDSDSDEDN